MLSLKIILILKLMFIGILVQFLDGLKPYGCASIYAFLIIVLGLFVEMPLMDLMIYCSFSFIFAFVYFWLLDKAVQDFIWWTIAIIGFLLIISYDALIFVGG